MSPITISAYTLATCLLLLKSLTTISIQGVVRIRTRRFQYAEDAAHWKGEAGQEAETVTRCQRLLRNDSETQPYFYVLGGLYTMMDAWPTGALVYFGLYVLTRYAHGWFLIHPRQPQRNLSFTAGVLVLLALSAHVLHTAVTLAAG